MNEIRPNFDGDFTAAVGVRDFWFQEGRSRCSIDVDERHHNPGGILHGGVLCTVADAGMGAAVFSTLKKGERTTALEIQVRFLRAVTRGRVTAESLVVHRGERLATTTAELRNDDGDLIAIASGTFYISPLSRGSERARSGEDS